ncbi:uncharacterized protein [Porites lutea]|uniref:uncharacterized protein n=1 Tax=Porites lutea TaxID=51062 RepID=UPI003CC6C6D2
MATSAVSTTDRFYFTKEQLQNTPSRKNGIDPEKEQSYRQQAATLIQDMGQRLSVSQLTINTAIVYMHRFYMFHSFSKFHRNHLAPCCLFLAAKIEEQPRKLEHVLKVAHACLHRDAPPLDLKSEEYLQQAQDLVENESILLQTLGFEITVHHPHTYVVKCIQLVRASKDLGQTSYFMATNSLHLTTLCLQYKPPVVACACIHLASKWSNWEIPRSNDGKDWWEYIDPSVNKAMLDEIAQDFLRVMEKCPNRLKRKINTVTNLKGVSHSKVAKGESSKVNSVASSGNLGLPSASSHNSLDGTHNGFNSHDGGHSQNDLDAKASHSKSRLDKDKEKEREKRKESTLSKLKPLPSSSTVTSLTGSGSSSSAMSYPPLPPLPPLTSKYATVTTASQMQPSESKVSTTAAHSTSGMSSSAKDPLSSRSKHRHHHHDESQPAKKHKSSHSHSQRSHSSAHRKPGSSSQSSDSSPSATIKHSHSSAHKSSSHAVKPLNPLHPSASQMPHTSSHSSSHSYSHSSRKPHPSSHHTSSSHKSSSSHHGHGHSSSQKSSSGSIDSSKKHSSTVKPVATATVARPITPPPPPPPPPPGVEFNVLSSLNAPGMLGVFPGAEMQLPVGQFPPQFLPPTFTSSVMPGMMQGMVPPPPPPDPEPSSPPPPPPPMP